MTTEGALTWSLPPEPGPEVRAVRDGNGYLITRYTGYGGGWNVPAGANGIDSSSISSWGEVLAYCKSPLTNATDLQELRRQLDEMDIRDYRAGRR